MVGSRGCGTGDCFDEGGLILRSEPDMRECRLGCEDDLETEAELSPSVSENRRSLTSSKGVMNQLRAEKVLGVRAPDGMGDVRSSSRRTMMFVSRSGNSCGPISVTSSVISFDRRSRVSCRSLVKELPHITANRGGRELKMRLVREHITDKYPAHVHQTGGSSTKQLGRRKVCRKSIGRGYGRGRWSWAK